VRFWDASALISTELEEKASRNVRELLRDDPELAIWVLTPVEIESALWRRHRVSNELDALGMENSSRSRPMSFPAVAV